jgi:hypothetical protein
MTKNPMMMHQTLVKLQVILLNRTNPSTLATLEESGSTYRLMIQLATTSKPQTIAVQEFDAISPIPNDNSTMNSSLTT